VKVIVDSLLEGAARARGTVVIIDVFRAFTTAAVAIANGAEKVIMVGTPDEALALRRAGIGQICMGEVGGLAPEGFDFGNSPHAVSLADLTGRTIIQRTSAGTQGIVTAAGAGRMFAGALVTARATARAILANATETVCLVGMGKNGVDRTDEDELCALHLRNLLQGRPGDAEAVRRVILAGGEAGRFADARGRDSHPGDLAIALDVDRYDFALRITSEDGRPTARRVDVG
jgi:2-phosphosulfolactate phosphatase